MLWPKLQLSMVCVPYYIIITFANINHHTVYLFVCLEIVRVCTSVAGDNFLVRAKILKL